MPLVYSCAWFPARLYRTSPQKDILNEPYEVDGARRPQRIFQQVFALDEAAFGEDLLSTQMPPRVRPGLALVAAGLGARSSFHIDPFEWLGWNYCVSGAKVWTFFSGGGDEGVHAVPSLRFAEKAPVAWGGDQSEEALREVGLLSSDRLCLAVGYESEIDVYADLSEDVLVGLAEASDEDVAAAVGDCAVVREALGAGLRVEVCVQRPEELVVIPAGTAHMVVHGAGSVGVAGQHCNTANEERVGAHALRRCRGNVRVAAEGLEVAVEAAIIAANGKERGEAICDVLWQEWDAYTA